MGADPVTWAVRAVTSEHQGIQPECAVYNIAIVDCVRKYGDSLQCHTSEGHARCRCDFSHFTFLGHVVQALACNVAGQVAMDY
jgi:hypothetical protein